MPQLFTNNARALLASGITDTATSLTVEASKADLFPVANVGTGAVPSVNNWFKLTLQDSSGNVEIVYVRTRTAGSGVMSNVIRGQEGTTARAFSAGTVAGVRITAADVESSIAAAGNSVQLTGDQTIFGTKTFSEAIVASGGVTGNVTGNAGTVTNGVYTTGDQTIGGVKTFSTSGGLKTLNPVVTRSDTVAEGGQINFERASDAALHYAIDVAGSGTTPNFRVINMVRSATSLTVDHSGNMTAEGNVTAYSDIRLKTDLTKISNALAKVNQLNGYTYTRIDSGERQTGVVAQEVQAVLPEAVIDGGEHLAVAYGNMVGLLIEAVKELTARVEKLEGK